MSPLGIEDSDDIRISAPQIRKLNHMIPPDPTSTLQDASEVDGPAAEGAVGLEATVGDQKTNKQEEEGNEAQAEVPVEEEKEDMQEIKQCEPEEVEDDKVKDDKVKDDKDGCNSHDVQAEEDGYESEKDWDAMKVEVQVQEVKDEEEEEEEKEEQEEEQEVKSSEEELPPMVTRREQWQQKPQQTRRGRGKGRGKGGRGKGRGKGGRGKAKKGTKENGKGDVVAVEDSEDENHAKGNAKRARKPRKAKTVEPEDEKDHGNQKNVD